MIYKWHNQHSKVFFCCGLYGFGNDSNLINGTNPSKPEIIPEKQFIHDYLNAPDQFERFGHDLGCNMVLC